MKTIEQNEKRMVIADEYSLFKLIKLLALTVFVTGVVAVILIFAEPDSKIYYYLFVIPPMLLLGGAITFRFQNPVARRIVVIDKEGKTFTFRISWLFSKERVFPLSQVTRALVGAYVEERDTEHGRVKTRYWELYFEIPEYKSAMVGDTLQQHRQRIVIGQSVDRMDLAHLESQINHFIDKVFADRTHKPVKPRPQEIYFDTDGDKLPPPPNL